MTKLAFIGLGVMGAPMAGFLATKGGFDVCVYNRTQEKSKNWCQQYGGNYAPTPKEAVVDADYVFACVGDDPDVREICLGEYGAFQAMKKNAVFVDHTTASASLAQELYGQAKRAQLGFIDAPVSGGQSGAENGVLSVMCGGDQADFDRVQPYINHYARTCKLLGGSGSGQLAKMVNQICIAGVLQGLAEAIAFGKKSGLDIAKVLEVISKGAAQSWQMENRGLTMDQDQFDFGFAVDWMRKDLRICLEQADQCKANLPITILIDQFYKKLQAQGCSKLDTSCLIKLLD